MEIGIARGQRHRTAKGGRGPRQESLGLEGEAEVPVKMSIVGTQLDRIGVGLGLLRPLAEAPRCRGEPQMRLQEVRCAAHGVSEGRLRLGVSALALEHQPQPAQPEAIGRDEAHGARIGDHCFRGTAHALEDAGEAAVQVRVVGLERERLAIGRRRLRPFPLPAVRIAQMDVPAHQPGCKAHRLAKGGRRFLVPALGDEHHAEAVVEDGVGRRHRHRLAVGADRLVRLAEARERHREVVAHLGIVRRKPHRFADRVLLVGVLALAAAGRGQAQPGQGVVALSPDRRAVRRLGLGPLPLALERDTQLELRLDAVRIEPKGRPQLDLGPRDCVPPRGSGRRAVASRRTRSDISP